LARRERAPQSLAVRLAPPPLRAELRKLLRLTLPLAATYLGQMALGAVDTAVVGRYDQVALAATGLAGGLYFVVAVLGQGWMLGLDPLLSQAVGRRRSGRGDAGETGEILAQGFILAALASLPLGLLMGLLGAGLETFGVDATTAGQTRAYLAVRVLGVVPFLAVTAGRSHLQAVEAPRPLVIGVVAANVVNLPLSIVLVFGWPALGLPALGAAGAAGASVAATFVQLAPVLLANRRLDRVGLRWPDPARLRQILRLGTPIGLQLAAEVGSFAIVGVLVARLGSQTLAAHQVALTLVALTFQLALALGAAGSVRVGQAIGERDSPGARRAGFVAIGTILVVMSVCMLAFVVAPRPLAWLITNDPTILDAAVPLLAVGAAFQLVDGVQATAAGVLRGAGDTRWPLLANLVGHYAIGLPVGLALLRAGAGAVGLWWGLAAGLGAVAVGLTLRFHLLSRKPIAEVRPLRTADAA
jgi:MATE family multidrug resistance protein